MLRHANDYVCIKFSTIQHMEQIKRTAFHSWNRRMAARWLTVRSNIYYYVSIYPSLSRLFGSLSPEFMTILRGLSLVTPYMNHWTLKSEKWAPLKSPCRPHAMQQLAHTPTHTHMLAGESRFKCLTIAFPSIIAAEHSHRTDCVPRSLIAPLLPTHPFDYFAHRRLVHCPPPPPPSHFPSETIAARSLTSSIFNRIADFIAILSSMRISSRRLSIKRLTSILLES